MCDKPETDVLTEETKQEQPETLPQEQAAEAVAEEVTEVVAAEEVTEEVVEEAPEEAPEEVVEEVTEDVAEQAPEAVSEEPEAPAAVQTQEPVKPEPKKKKAKKSRSIPVKILMAIIATILCIAIFAVSMAGVAILNVRAITSRGNITKIVNQLFTGETLSAPVRPALAVGAGTVYLEEPTTSQSEMSNMLVDWAYEVIQDAFGDEVELTKEQVKTFVAESTVKDFVADKAAGLVEDFYAEESNTTITAEEITQLMKENMEIIEQQFGVVVDQEVLDEMDVRLQESGVLAPIEEQGLMGYIEQTLTEGDEENSFSEAKKTLDEVKEIMGYVRLATSYKMVAAVAGLLLLLMVLLFFVTGGLPAALSQTGSMILIVGLIFCVPVALTKFAPELICGILGDELGGIVTLIFQTTANLNLMVVGVGFVLIVAAIVVKIIKGVRRAKALVA